VCGWFTRIERGLYELTPEGALALRSAVTTTCQGFREPHGVSAAGLGWEKGPGMLDAFGDGETASLK
jgi:hypothetical protein